MSKKSKEVSGKLVMNNKLRDINKNINLFNTLRRFLYEKFQKKYFILLIIVFIFLAGCSSSSIAPISIKGTQIEYFFSREGQHPDGELVSLINSTHKSLDIAIYSITKKNIVDAIIEAEKRGIKVRIITDNETSKNKYENSALYRINDAGIPIKVNKHSGLMHMKVMISDDSTVTTGSFNYTDSATYKNDEVLVVIHDLSSTKVFEKEFSKMWNDYSNFENY